MVVQLNKKVLIVEDDDLMLNILTQHFIDFGFDVVTAIDGDQGIQKFLKEKPDAVILDIVLPRKDGIEMLDEIHKLMPHDKTPITILTNSNDMDNIASAMSRKITTYLVKSDQELKNIVDTVKHQLNITDLPPSTSAK